MVRRVNSEEAQIILTSIDSEDSQVLFRGSVDQCKLVLKEKFKQDLKDKFKQCEQARWLSEGKFVISNGQGESGSVVELVTDKDRIDMIVNMD